MNRRFDFQLDSGRPLREFRVADLDGNQLRVFYDFTWELPQQQD